jgi:hypothetical protein
MKTSISGATDMDNEQQKIEKPPLSPAAKRALEEAEARRKAVNAAEPPKEVGGRGGADPARFGDWEIKGRAIDF